MEVDSHAYIVGPPCPAEYLHEGAHQCDREGCETRPEDHPADD